MRTIALKFKELLDTRHPGFKLFKLLKSDPS
jgi:hypothetical protein